jgi:hypothetical protein
MDIHGISLDRPCIFHIYVSGLQIHGIYHVYTRHIQKIRVLDARIKSHCSASAVSRQCLVQPPLLPDHAELEAVEQAQRDSESEAARARASLREAQMGLPGSASGLGAGTA